MAKVKNTAPEQFEDTLSSDSKNIPEIPAEKEDLLEREPDILAGLLALGDTRNNPDEYRKIEIKRQGQVLLEFRIRPLSEKEMISCNEQATRYAPAKGGKPRTAIKTDAPKMRSLFIYTATVDEDRKKIWDNPQAKQKFNILERVGCIIKCPK